MNHKEFKLDLIYCIKKLVKDSKTLTIAYENLEIVDGKFALKDNNFDALESLTLIKGYQYTPIVYTDKWKDPQGVEHEYRWLHHETFGIPIIDIVAQEAKISKDDLYEFYNGLENVEGSFKNDFYIVGVYIREKFLPIGAHKELLLQPKVQSPTYKGEVVKRFIVHTRPLPGCCKTSDAPSIIEVEGERISSLEDSSVMTLPASEFKFRILKPDTLYEPSESKQADGSKKKTMVPPVYYSHAIYADLAEAQAAAKRMIKSGLDFEVRKGRLASYTEEELEVKCAEIQTIMLP